MAVMLSYSTKDKDTALLLRNVLVAKDIRVWLDRIDILPGENWQKAIEKAIRDCSQMILLLSQHSLASPEVEAEWSLARELGKTILAVRVENVPVPFRLGPYQYVDYFELGPEETVRRLSSVLPRERQERHCLGEMGQQHPLLREFAEVWHKPLYDQNKCILVKPSAYPSLQALLNEVYTNYLAAEFKPYTYGSAWLLKPQRSDLLVLPIEWIVSPGKPIQEVAPAWASATVPEHAGIVPDSVWHVVSGQYIARIIENGAFGLVGHNPSAVLGFLDGIKFRGDEIDPHFRRIDDVDLGHYEMKCVIARREPGPLGAVLEYKL